jgi:hypothetical protein
MSGGGAVCEHLWATIMPWRKRAYEWCPYCDSRRRRRPAALSALHLAFPLGLIGSAGYAVLVRGENVLDDLTLRENLTVVGVVLVLWLLFWLLITLSRRRSG